jgi:arylsulfatase A-like enzyme
MHRLSRRTFLELTAAASLSGCASVRPAEDRPADDLPNVLLILTDEQNLSTLSCYGGHVETPHIDSLAADGALFRNYFTNSASCAPSRGCLLTGRYPHAHGAYFNDIEMKRDEVTLGHVLTRAGYDTGYAGKWHLDGPGRPGWIAPERSMGFAECRWMYNRGHWKSVVERPNGWPENRSVTKVGGGFDDPSPEQLKAFVAEAPDGRPDLSYRIGDGEYFTDWLTDKAIEFLEAPRQRPFFYMLSIPDPHFPFTVRPPYDTMYDPAAMPIPSTFRERNLPSWAEEFRQEILKSEGLAWDDPQREVLLRRWMAQYFGQVKNIDDNVGRILASLRASGRLDNTVILFTTDHGDYMGEHGLYRKEQFYETAHHLPLLIRWPRKIEAGTEVERFFASVDLAPTLYGLLGLEPSGREQGRDGSAFLTGGTVEWTDEVHIHHDSLERAGIFTPEHELGLVKEGDNCLYDRVNDPEQVRNQYADPAKAAVVEELTDRVRRHHREVDSPAAEWLG